MYGSRSDAEEGHEQASNHNLSSADSSRSYMLDFKLLQPAPEVHSRYCKYLRSGNYNLDKALWDTVGCFLIDYISLLPILEDCRRLYYNRQILQAGQ
jgi:hypothetical protein